MNDVTQHETKLQDYQPPGFLVDQVDLGGRTIFSR